MEKRNLSGIYVRYQNPENNKWENWCIEELPEEERTNFLQNKSKEWCIGVINCLSNSLNNIGKTFDIFSE